MNALYRLAHCEESESAPRTQSRGILGFCASTASGAVRRPPATAAMKRLRSITGSSHRGSASQARGYAERGETGPGPCGSPPYRLAGSLAETPIRGGRDDVLIPWRG